MQNLFVQLVAVRRTIFFDVVGVILQIWNIVVTKYKLPFNSSIDFLMVLAGFLIENGNFFLTLAHGNFNAGYRSSEVVKTLSLLSLDSLTKIRSTFSTKPYAIR